MQATERLEDGKKCTNKTVMVSFQLKFPTSSPSPQFHMPCFTSSREQEGPEAFWLLVLLCPVLRVLEVHHERADVVSGVAPQRNLSQAFCNLQAPKGQRACQAHVLGPACNWNSLYKGSKLPLLHCLRCASKHHSASIKSAICLVGSCPFSGSTAGSKNEHLYVEAHLLWSLPPQQLLACIQHGLLGWHHIPQPICRHDQELILLHESHFI